LGLVRIVTSAICMLPSDRSAQAYDDGRCMVRDCSLNATDLEALGLFQTILAWSGRHRTRKAPPDLRINRRNTKDMAAHTTFPRPSSNILDCLRSVFTLSRFTTTLARRSRIQRLCVCCSSRAPRICMTCYKCAYFANLQVHAR
jgi:hypothetical protein